MLCSVETSYEFVICDCDCDRFRRRDELKEGDLVIRKFIAFDRHEGKEREGKGREGREGDEHKIYLYSWNGICTFFLLYSHWYV